MGAPLYDITLYYDGNEIKDSAKEDFRRIANYVCDFYHQMLFGYKPPGTGRICIHLGVEEVYKRPLYTGAICTIGWPINEEEYLSLKRQDQMFYILRLVHEVCLELCSMLGWERPAFDNAYNRVVDKKLIFSLRHPSKLSRDRQASVSVIIDKTIDSSSLKLEIVKEGRKEEVILFTKRNWFSYDTVYEFAKNTRWIDKSTFSLLSESRGKVISYSIEEKIVKGDTLFLDEDL